MSTNNSKSSDFHNTLYKFMDELSQLVMREHQMLQNELLQVRSVVGDAVSTLDTIFRRLQSHSKDQASVVATLRNDSAVSEKQQHQLDELAEKISSDTLANVRALQFDDIVQQLATHSCNRIARMQQLFVELDMCVSNLNKLETQDTETSRQQIVSMQEKVSEFRGLLEKENPVKQTSMREGNIELF